MLRMRDVTVEPETLRDILHDAKGLLNHQWTWAKISKKSGIKESTLLNFTSGATKRLHVDDTKRICDFIEDQTDSYSKAYLLEKYRTHLAGVFPSVSDPGESLGAWLRLTDQESTEFARSCQGGRGRYLLLRQDGEGNLVSALMFVQPATRRRRTATFLTYRPTKGGDAKIAKGFLYELDGRVFSYGLSRYPRGVRTAQLLPRTVGNRMDLAGIRLGLSSVSDRPFAHRIYCLQLPRKQPWAAIKAVLGCHPTDDPAPFLKIVSGHDFERIRNFLHVEEFWDNGLSMGW